MVLSYIKYLLTAKNRHGIHSPFVYDFNDKCLSEKINDLDEKIIFDYYHKLLKSNQEIVITDLGAGSKKLGKHRKIKDIAKISGSNKKYGALLYKIVKHYQPKNIVELGTSLGIGTLYLSLANKAAKITTIEGCPETFLARENLFPKTEQLKNINFIHKDFNGFLKNNLVQPIDLIFIDGDHKSSSLFQQIDLIYPYLENDSIVILDDIRWNKDMLFAWNQLSKDKRFHVSIDLFKTGILLKRKQQEKENFLIRY